MTQPKSSAGTGGPTAGYSAQWSPARAGEVLITDQAGMVVDMLQVAVPGDRPVPGMLAGFRWSGYPGSEWQESAYGQWLMPVYLQRISRGGGA